MKHYSKYLIGATDQFDPANYSAIVDEICIINEKTNAVPVHFKADIITSFLKDHAIQKNWMESNPELSELIASQTFFTGSIESLFDSCRNNPVFRKDLEAYLKESFTGHSQP